MATKALPKARLKFEALTPSRWRDLEMLFGERGACGGCWCMWWRMKRAEFKQGKGEKNRKGLKKIVACGEVPGIIAYYGGGPVGWCALAPREKYPVLENSRILAPIDGEPVWSVVCFFVARPYRGRGARPLARDARRVSGARVHAARQPAAACGARPARDGCAGRHDERRRPRRAARRPGHCGALAAPAAGRAGHHLRIPVLLPRASSSRHAQ